MNNVQTKIDKDTVISLSRDLGEPAWLADIRGNAFEAFCGMKWPQPDDEEWRRTSLESVKIDDDRIISALGAFPIGTSGDDAGGHDAMILHLTQPGAAQTERLENLRPLLEKTAGDIDNKFAALNWSRWSDGFLIYVPADTELTDPIILDYTGLADGEINNIHTIIFLEPGAAATVIQNFAGGDDSALWNVLTTAGVGEGAQLSIAYNQEVPDTAGFFGQYTFLLEKDSRLESFEAYTGSKLTKSRNEVFLNGTGGDARLNGIYLSGEGQHMDMRTVQYHRQRSGQSRAFFRGAVSGTGRSVYQGLIDVDKLAVGTDAYLTNNNLILNDGARADSIPCLEIRTDDVKCSHGSTSGKLDEESLFYLMSRGLSRKEAKEELITGYFEESVIKAPEVLRERIRRGILNLVG